MQLLTLRLAPENKPGSSTAFERRKFAMTVKQRNDEVRVDTAKTIGPRLAGLGARTWADLQSSLLSAKIAARRV